MASMKEPIWAKQIIPVMLRMFNATNGADPRAQLEAGILVVCNCIAAFPASERQRMLQEIIEQLPGILEATIEGMREGLVKKARTE